MIRLKLQEIAQRLGKSISDIARETGINRNTITALYHGKVEGVRFSTLEKLCAAYDLTLANLLERDAKKAHPETRRTDRLYRQEGEIIPFTCFPSMLVAGASALPPEFLGLSFEGLYAYYRKGYAYYYWHTDALNVMAEQLYKRYAAPRQFAMLYEKFRKYADELERLYRDAYQRSFAQDTNEELQEYFVRLRSVYHKFWEHSLFIDAYDSGFDTAEIQRITQRYRFSLDDVAALSAPEERIFANERLYRLLRMIRPVFRKNIPRNRLRNFLQQFFTRSEEFRQYQEDFDYVLSNYVHVQHVTLENTVAEAEKFLKDKKRFDREFHWLQTYGERQHTLATKVLRKHKISQNPISFFAKLTYWREYQKKVNLMGIHVLNALLDVVEARTGIPKKYLLFLSLDEFSGVLKGLVTKEMLQERYEEGVLITLEDSNYSMVIGKEAASLRRDLEKRFHTENIDATTLSGQVACQGYAQGTAQVILNQKDFRKFRDGNILVTGMTRPEFVPLMKRAAAIVTNDGGITSHAVIISRELGKPCIIGTKIATDMIHTGDLIEVRAHHGTVRILKKADRAKRSA